MKRLHHLCTLLVGIGLLTVLSSCDNNKKGISQEELLGMIDNTSTESKQPEEPVTETVAGIESLFLHGTIGGADDAEFSYDAATDDGTVTFTIEGVQNNRKIKQGSFNLQTGRLVMKEYFTNGTYIGDFVGTWKNGIYSGVFTNKQSGGKVDFYLRK